MQQKVMKHVDTNVAPEIDKTGRRAWTLIAMAKTIWLFKATQSAALVIDVDMKPSPRTKTIANYEKIQAPTLGDAMSTDKHENS